MPKVFDIIVSIHCHVTTGRDVATETAILDTVRSIEAALSTGAPHFDGLSHPVLPDAEVEIGKVLGAGLPRGG